LLRLRRLPLSLSFLPTTSTFSFSPFSLRASGLLERPLLALALAFLSSCFSADRLLPLPFSAFLAPLSALRLLAGGDAFLAPRGGEALRRLPADPDRDRSLRPLPLDDERSRVLSSSLPLPRGEGEGFRPRDRSRPRPRLSSRPPRSAQHTREKRANTTCEQISNNARRVVKEHRRNDVIMVNLGKAYESCHNGKAQKKTSSEAYPCCQPSSGGRPRASHCGGACHLIEPQTGRHESNQSCVNEHSHPKPFSKHLLTPHTHQALLPNRD
jgi:hypothetical protein